MENKLGMVFPSDDFIKWRDNKGVLQHKIGKREYIAYLGVAEEFKKHLFAVALENGYGSHQQTILLSDGATWTLNMKNELFLDAQQILDFIHLKKRVTDFAKDIFDNNETKYRLWVDNMCELLKGSTKEKLSLGA
jgi:hypothetical protein